MRRIKTHSRGSLIKYTEKKQLFSSFNSLGARHNYILSYEIVDRSDTKCIKVRAAVGELMLGK